MNKDPTKELALMLASGWKVASLAINNDGTNSRGRAVIYTLEPESWREQNRRRQAAGVIFQRYSMFYGWHEGQFIFDGPEEEDYREDPQPIPHEAERALWKAQREAGTNEVWQQINEFGSVCDIPLSYEPLWHPKCTYRPKPKPAKLTARITRLGYGAKVYDWEFYGTPEEYCAECEKCGYAVVSEIKEVIDEPEMAKYYFCMVDSLFSFISIKGETKDDFKNRLVSSGHVIVGDVEEREVEV